MIKTKIINLLFFHSISKRLYMNSIDEQVLNILENEKDKMNRYLEWYLSLSGNFNGKIRIDIKYAQSIKDELINLEEPYPTKLAYMLNINLKSYNNKYQNYIQYESLKMKAYSLLYLEKTEITSFYDEDIGFSIGLELIIKEFIDKHPQFNNLIKINKTI